jgi:hypothetical protein
MGTRANRNQAHGMRQRLRPLRARFMARRSGLDGRFSLSPRERRILGWVVALVLVLGIALVVRVVGGDADGAPVAADGSASPSAVTALEIAFGTAIDPATGEVAVDARTNRFAAPDPFAYSVRPPAPVPTTIYVEVERTGGGTLEIVQGPDSDWEQTVADGSATIAFTVPAANLHTDFGPGEYRMRIFETPDAAPMAEGAFVLVADPAPASTSPSAAP